MPRGIRGRDVGGGKYQIAFGHHRVAAAKEMLGVDFVATIEVDDFSERELLQMMAHENAEASAENVGHAMQCVEQAAALLDQMIARVPSLYLQSQAKTTRG